MLWDYALKSSSSSTSPTARWCQRCPRKARPTSSSAPQLIVQENQEAVFFRDGKALDIFRPGRHTLTTANVPILTRLLTIPWEKSPFQALVYFIGKQTFLDQKWGTQQPITLRDADFGIVRLASFGKFSFRVADSSMLIDTLVGTQGKYTTDEVTYYLRDLIVSRLTEVLAGKAIGILEPAGPLRPDRRRHETKVMADFTKYGLELCRLLPQLDYPARTRSKRRSTPAARWGRSAT